MNVYSNPSQELKKVLKSMSIIQVKAWHLSIIKATMYFLFPTCDYL